MNRRRFVAKTYCSDDRAHADSECHHGPFLLHSIRVPFRSGIKQG